MDAPCWYDDDDELISISFRFDNEFTKDCQRITGRRWNGVRKVNTFPLESAPEVKILTTKWGIKVDDGLKQRPQWDATPLLQPSYNVAVDGNWIAMYFTYKQEIIDSIHDGIPGAAWNDDKRRWQASLINANDAVLFAEQWGLTVEPSLAAEAHKYIALANDNFRVSGLIKSEPFPIPGLQGDLRPYQFSCVEYSVRNNRVIIADAPGLGKGLESLSVMMMKGSLPCVITCKAKLKYTLRDEVWKWFPGSTAMVLNGTEVFPIPEVDFIILNYDIAHSWYETLIERGFKSLIIDESHYIKNGKRSLTCSTPGCTHGMKFDTIKKCPKCKAVNVTANRKYSVRRTNAVMQMALSLPSDAPILGLTATPLDARPRELIRQLEAIDRLDLFGGESKFKYRYCGTDGKGAFNLPELHRKLRENCYVRRRVEDVFQDLPPEQYIPRFVEVSDKDMERYRSVERDVVEYFAQRAAAEARAKGSNAEWAAYCKREQLERVKDIVQLSGLRSVLSEIKREPVVEWIKEFDEETDGEEKLIIFGEHINLVDHIYNSFSHEADNFRNSKNNQNDVVRFQTDPTIRKWIANLQASKEGFTLTAASYVVFTELPWSPTWLTQGLGRARGRASNPHHAIGYPLLVKGTVDEEMWAMLDEKRAVVNAVTDGIDVPENQITVEEELRLAWMDRGRRGI
jgi:SWI/SNF-related matrix-associated actin-dependent regulator 1 of chromatin subfamily A